MPTINWIGKDKVVNHHLEVPFYTLEHKYGFRAEDETDTSETHSGNMIIHGDNLVALKALLPEYEGRVNGYKYFMVFEHNRIDDAVDVQELLEILKGMC